MSSNQEILFLELKMENRNGLRMVMKIVMENILGKLKMGNQMEQGLSHLLMERSM